MIRETLVPMKTRVAPVPIMTRLVPVPVTIIWEAKVSQMTMVSQVPMRTRMAPEPRTIWEALMPNASRLATVDWVALESRKGAISSCRCTQNPVSSVWFWARWKHSTRG